MAKMEGDGLSRSPPMRWGSGGLLSQCASEILGKEDSKRGEKRKLDQSRPWTSGDGLGFYSVRQRTSLWVFSGSSLPSNTSMLAFARGD